MKESAIISTIMVRTLMDERYYYGIRQEAAFVLSKVVPLTKSY
jgi:transcription initiation factor TFIID subunit 2